MKSVVSPLTMLEERKLQFTEVKNFSNFIELGGDRARICKKRNYEIKMKLYHWIFKQLLQCIKMYNLQNSQHSQNTCTQIIQILELYVMWR